MQFTSKLPDLPTTIFTIMSRLSHEHSAINLSQGFPNFEPDPVLVNLVSEAMNSGYNQYAPMAGTYSLREAISNKINSLYSHKYNPEHEITVTSGATQAIYTIISTFIHKNDEVIILKPAYDCYEPAIESNGGIPVFVQLEGSNFKINWEVLKQKINPKTKMLIINTPHNPSGSILSDDDMKKLASLLKDTNIILLSDEVYEHIVFDGEEHHSASKYPDLAERTFVCASFGKTFHTTGWKMGYCAAPKELMDEFRKIHQFNVFCVDHPKQKALTTYLKTPENYLSLNQFYQNKRDVFLEAMAKTKFRFTPSKGTFFQLMDYTDITDEADTVFAERLVKEFGVAAIPVSVFNVNNEDHKVLRFCFAKKDETLVEAAEILARI
ncbi:methionine aminotransferase [Spongiivirga citrea]|uniref:Aminotransferase class I/II-fold pyridoxal phosphate-dependent enzyme n=1 Tax=Spongiivirga citrea TaxID=1481457 RepID=A0A6M0CNN2_9FLAO|nr:methionine aminotransferase [Spongiivirga citrea]NER17077.1 aminotransferase class I/II-fold pyridoxal phosphate-dependent enzyme [Spongiivirga citrea]